jgi:radical SAM superfamily enzyme YgiQ (UPF0313 family)
MMPDVCAAHFDSVVVGEGEPVWNQVLADAKAGCLKPRYQQTCPADVNTLPQPRVDLYLSQEKPDGAFCPDDYPVQTSRGCPMTCVACVLPTVMGRSMRAFPVEHILGQLEQLGRAG